MLTTEASNSSHARSSLDADFVAWWRLPDELPLFDIHCSCVMVYRGRHVFIVALRSCCCWPLVAVKVFLVTVTVCYNSSL